MITIVFVIMLLFALAGFIGGLLVGLHETIGLFINAIGIIAVFIWIFWSLLSDLNAISTKTNLETLITTGLSILCAIILAISWLIRKALGTL